jgi:DNA-binding GntR family transcriptional regulator
VDAGARRRPQRHSLRDQVLAGLRGALLAGELKAGEVYSAPALAERFGVSATPVREAMQQLVREGAVVALPNKGFRVALRTDRELAELAEVRALLEVPTVLRLARSVPPRRWHELRPLADAATEAAAGGDPTAYAEADRRFHAAVLALSGNTQLVALAADLHHRTQRPAAAGPRPGRAALSADAAEHHALLDALASGDLPRVEILTQSHCTTPRPAK